MNKLFASVSLEKSQLAAIKGGTDGPMPQTVSVTDGPMP